MENAEETTSDASRQWWLRHRIAIVVAVTVVALVAVACWSLFRPGAGDPAADTDPARDRFANFDPREVQHLQDLLAAGGVHVPEDSLLASLEFRQACRVVSTAIGVAASTVPDARTGEVHALMGPVVQRTAESGLDDGTLLATYERIEGELSSGELALPQSWVHASCSGDDTLSGGYLDPAPGE